ncbi:MAG: DUF6614 family protein [Pseudomonadota bacterium]
MIHMLSRFDLKPGVSIEAFSQEYSTLVEQMRAKGLVSSTGQIGRREADTPMDTDADDAPEYYVVMSFADREQLDRSYAYLTDTSANQATSHPAVNRSVTNHVFTCWQDLD